MSQAVPAGMNPNVKLVRFPSIEPPEKVFKHLISASHFVRYDKRTKTSVYDSTLPLPILTLRGTVKLHGANCSIVQTRISKDEKITHFQSRNKVLGLEPGKDYMGFNTHMSKHLSMIDAMFKYLFDTRQKASGKPVVPDDISSIAIFGEWCGGTIQKDIAISQFETMFVIFAVKLIYNPGALRRKQDELAEWMDMSLIKDMHEERARIFNVRQFTTWELTVDLANDQDIEDTIKLMEEYTLEVQEECPVAKKLGANSVLTNGEGIVWHVIKLATHPMTVPNPNLKLERFSAPGCWMKTRDVKGSVAAELLRAKKQAIASAASWRRDDQVESPELAFNWEEPEPASPETPRRSMPPLRVGITWSAGKSPRDSAVDGLTSPESLSTPPGDHSRKRTMSNNASYSIPAALQSNVSANDEPLSAAFLASRPHPTNPKVAVPHFLDNTRVISTFTSFGPPLALNPTPPSLNYQERSIDHSLIPEADHCDVETLNSMSTERADTQIGRSETRTPSVTNTYRAVEEVMPGMSSDENSEWRFEQSEAAPYSLNTTYKYAVTEDTLSFDSFKSEPANISYNTLIDPSIMEQLDQLAVQQVPTNHRSDSIFNIYGSMESLVNFITSESRLQQGLHEMDNEWLQERHIHSVGPFVEWVIKDAFKEQAHRIYPSGFNREEVAAAIGAKAARWYFNHLPKQWWVPRDGLADRFEVEG